MQQSVRESSPAADGVAAAAANGGAAGETGATASEPFDITNVEPEVLIEMATGYAVPAIKALVIIVIAWLLAAWVRRITRGAMERARVEPTISRFTSNLARWGVLTLGLIAVLGIFGVETASFAVVIGALGLAIGLALQGTLGNAAAGFMLLIFRPFKVDDVVSAAGVTGKVIEVELFSTVIDTPDNRRLIVPNGAIFGATIENVTHHPTRRVDVEVGVAYAADIARTRGVLLAAAQGVEEGLADPPPAIVLTKLGSSSVNWTVRLWVNSTDFWPAQDKLTERVKNALDAADISIPFPQMDVWMRKSGDA